MTEHNELLPNLLDEDAFEVQMRGYSRRQVDEFVARTRSQTRDLEERLARALDDSEQVRQQLAVARQPTGARKLTNCLSRPGRRRNGCSRRARRARRRSTTAPLAGSNCCPARTRKPH